MPTGPGTRSDRGCSTAATPLALLRIHGKIPAQWFGILKLPVSRGTYIVEVVPPPGYVLVKEEDKNVDFGNQYVPSPLAYPPPVCVGRPTPSPRN